MKHKRIKRTARILTLAVTVGAMLTLPCISASADDTYQSADVGNYVRSYPYGEVVGSIGGNHIFSPLSVMTSWDGTVWGLCGDGNYICLDYCTYLYNNSYIPDYNYDDYSYDDTPTWTEQPDYNDYGYYSNGFLNSNQQYIYSHFANNGMPAESAAAIASNTYDESACDTNAYCIDTNGLPSYGICQWNGERYDSLYYWCLYNGYDYTSLDGQIAYLDYELKNFYPYVFNQLMDGGDAWSMGYIWASQFEICADIYWNTRGDNAASLYNGIW